MKCAFGFFDNLIGSSDSHNDLSYGKHVYLVLSGHNCG
jgi:hypothetical protein